VAFRTIGNDLAVPVEIARIEQLRVPGALAGKRRARLFRPAWQLERAEGTAEAFMLLVIDRGVPHYQHAVAIHRRLDRLHQFRRRIDGEVSTGQLGGEQGTKWRYLHRCRLFHRLNGCKNNRRMRASSMWHRSSTGESSQDR